MGIPPLRRPNRFCITARRRRILFGLLRFRELHRLPLSLAVIRYPLTKNRLNSFSCLELPSFCPVLKARMFVAKNIMASWLQTYICTTLELEAVRVLINSSITITCKVSCIVSNNTWTITWIIVRNKLFFNLMCIDKNVTCKDNVISAFCLRGYRFLSSHISKYRMYYSICSFFSLWGISNNHINPVRIMNRLHLVHSTSYFYLTYGASNTVLVLDNLL